MIMIQLPELPYALDSLTPAISARTMQYHYNAHTATYIDNVNRLVTDTPFAHTTIEDVIRIAPEGALLNNAAQAWNHLFYFFGLTPDGADRPDGQLLHAIEHSFGSFEQFVDAFVHAGTAIFGSGWVWLTANDDGELSIQTGCNAYNPLRQGLKPLLTADVWEHAYYLDYQNRRGEALRRLIDLIDWNMVMQRYMTRT